MFVRLLFAFILIPFVELVLLLRMSEVTGWKTTLAIVVITGMIGSLLARREGVAAIGRFRAALGEGRMPGREIQDGLMIAFAAALLLTPGLLTDGLGFALLTPMGRTWIGGFLRRRYGGRFQMHTSGFGPSGSASHGRAGSEDVSGWQGATSSWQGASGGPRSSGSPVTSGSPDGETPPRSRPRSDGYTIDSPSFGPKHS